MFFNIVVDDMGKFATKPISLFSQFLICLIANFAIQIAVRFASVALSLDGLTKILVEYTIPSCVVVLLFCQLPVGDKLRREFASLRKSCRQFGAAASVGAIPQVLPFVFAIFFGYHVGIEIHPVAIFGALLMALGSSVVEEIFFRGLILEAFRQRFGQLVAILMLSVIVALLHSGLKSVLGLLEVFLVAGLAYSAACIFWRSLLVPIGLHFGNNLVATYFFGYGGEFPGALQNNSLNGNYQMASTVLGALLLLSILVLLAFRNDLNRGSIGSDSEVSPRITSAR